jgi:hypothetical protein
MAAASLIQAFEKARWPRWNSTESANLIRSCDLRHTCGVTKVTCGRRQEGLAACCGSRSRGALGDFRDRCGSRHRAKIGSSFCSAFEGRKRKSHVAKMMATTVAKRLVEHLTRYDLVILKKPPIGGSAPPYREGSS